MPFRGTKGDNRRGGHRRRAYRNCNLLVNHARIEAQASNAGSCQEFAGCCLCLGLCVGKGRIEQPPCGFEPHFFFHEPCRFGGSVFAIHPGVFPFNRKGTVVPNVIEGPGDLFEIDLSAAGRPEIPAPAWITEVQVRWPECRFDRRAFGPRP